MDSEQEISAEDAHETPYAGAGMRLRAARETRRLELSQIAAETRIPLRHLEAIEAGDFAALPSRTYAIGFSRTYARMLGLDDAAIADAVRGELAEGNARRSTVGTGMEPGDPAKLPSRGLAWFGAFAALVLAIGLIAFFGTRFGAGVGPAPLEAPKPAASLPVAAAPAPIADGTGPVMLTAIEDGVWVRIYEEGGERLLEKQLAKDESFTLPADAADPRINTARPDLLAITIGGKSVPRLAERPTMLAGTAISAEALLGRPEPEPSPVPAVSPAPRRVTPAPVATATATAAVPAAVPVTPAVRPSPAITEAVAAPVPDRSAPPAPAPEVTATPAPRSDGVAD
ncbi:helix-turn-helix domain-containing protein [Erythrobacter dokdonensis]|uniref:Putative Xre family transcriptional regulator n=1 Tax=Erythrobacter dokdonensis DSW-74 TaxID=1300349 RepID=A0A1A7BJB4_9SPHN|nr:helix-turn-helix transcriptional regulator [Erythrobacter dokdonensis]OBV11285.1 putative Xre family transcriptional regulator [Erythrobacter dokdonensis DSW-74]